MSPRNDDVAYAANWRSVLAADAALGVVPLVVGAVLALSGTGWGAVLALAGTAYVVLVARRAMHWRRLRRDAGLG